jgi:hypothetical protein
LQWIIVLIHKILQFPSANNNKILKYWFDTKNDSQQVSSIPSRIDIDGVFFKYGSLKILSYQSNGMKRDNKFYTVQFSSSLRSLKILLVIL